MSNISKNKNEFNFFSSKIFIRPFTYIQCSIGNENITFLVLLLLQVIMLFVTKSYFSILIIFSAVLASCCANFFSKLICYKKNEMYYSYIISIVQGLITGMLIPDGYPLATVFIITLCSMLIFKHFFSGFSNSLVNPSVFAIAVLWVIGAANFGQYPLTIDILSSRNPSQILIENGFFQNSSFDNSVTDFFNNVIFNLFKVSIPEGYPSLFWDTHSIIPAFRFNFITILSSVIVFSKDIVRALPSIFFLVVYLLLVRLVSPFFFHGLMFQGDMILALLTSGTLFYAVFVIGWYGTTPYSIIGKCFYGFFTGILAFFITGCGLSSVGMAFTVLIGNFVSVVIQYFENIVKMKNTEKVLENAKREGYL